MKKTIIYGSILVSFLFGCASAKGNKGAEIGDVGLNNKFKMAADIGRDVALSSNGSIGITLVALAALVVAGKAVKKT